MIRETISHRFARAKYELEKLVPDADIQHVGSTAIPGCLTKGDLDIQVRVNSNQYLQAKKRLCAVYNINSGGFVANDATSFDDYNATPSIGIHLTIIGGSCDIQYKFRDILLKSSMLRKEYDDFKLKYEGGFMEEYRNAKAYFVERIMKAEES